KGFLLLILGFYSDLRDLLLLPWPDLELHLSDDEFLRGYGGSNAMWKDVEGVWLQRGDKEVTRQYWWPRVVMEVLGYLLGDTVVRS
ncbi:hypothetical protein Tco_0761882, partial [Tanacetum coccineum]